MILSFLLSSFYTVIMPKFFPFDESRKICNFFPIFFPVKDYLTSSRKFPTSNLSRQKRGRLTCLATIRSEKSCETNCKYPI